MISSFWTFSIFSAARLKSLIIKSLPLSLASYITTPLLMLLNSSLNLFSLSCVACSACLRSVISFRTSSNNRAFSKATAAALAKGCNFSISSLTNLPGVSSSKFNNPITLLPKQIGIDKRDLIQLVSLKIIQRGSWWASEISRGFAFLTTSFSKRILSNGYLKLFTKFLLPYLSYPTEWTLYNPPFLIRTILQAE